MLQRGLLLGCLLSGLSTGAAFAATTGGTIAGGSDPVQVASEIEAAWNLPDGADPKSEAR